MNPALPRQFSILLEHLLSEASTTLDLLRQYPKLREIIIAHHKARLPADAKWQVNKKIPAKAIKDSRAFALFFGRDGVAFVSGNYGTYKIDYVINADGKTNEFYANSQEGLIRRITLAIGPIQQVYITMDSKAVKFDTGGGFDIPDTLLRRFKPLWIKMLTAALADVKGFINTQIKNHAFAAARNKLEIAKGLQDDLDQLMLDDSHFPRHLAAAVSAALSDTYHHNRSEDDTLTSGERRHLVFDKIKAGDGKMLGLLLQYTKNRLLTT